jgi:hypothetical protein
MSWFLIAYTATGLSVAVSPSYEKKLCNEMQMVATTLLSGNKYTLKCEQHKKRPKLTGKVDRVEQGQFDSRCDQPSNVCVMFEYDREHGLPLGTSSAQYLKEREK